MKRVYLLVAVLFVLLPGCRDDGGTAPSGNTWVAIEPTQCLTNPWEQDWLENNDGDYAGYPKDPTHKRIEPEEFRIIQGYYARQGVAVFDGTARPKFEAVCLACSCPEGHTLYLLVRKGDVSTMSGLGYRVEAPGASD